MELENNFNFINNYTKLKFTHIIVNYTWLSLLLPSPVPWQIIAWW